ncbi:WD repeat-containing protein 34 [Agrilus planipennis]|uniref:WD repeat-containing protein 34 n=1 Tax=Agrilus planipennis TaxID=224129 RepID=A0A1W4WBI6_AGRPL|nr:WD repeat-containing protein 34 [Agrilus planipennis]
MLSVKEAECVGFDSKWRVKKIAATSSSQTDEILKQNSETNTSEKKSIETQTDAPRINYDVKYDVNKLGNFLKRIYPKLAAELDDDSSSSIFKNYCPFDEPIFSKAKIVQTVNVNLEVKDNVASRVNSLSWNSTGNTIAVSSDYPHQNWCHHFGFVSLYTFDRYEMFPEIPSRKVKTGACVRAVAFHPKLPYILSAGTHTGDIYLWNIQHDENEMLVDKIVGHDDSITGMQWIVRNDKNDDMVLATSSTDGFINMWKFSSKAHQLILKRKYKMKPPILQKQPEMTLETDLCKSIGPGILGFHFSYFTPEKFVVAAEGGIVVQCSTLGAQTIIGTTGDTVPILNPCVLFCEPHNDQITTIKFSPNHKEQFLTNSVDGEIRIYLLEQDTPVRVICLKKPLSVVNWVPYHDKVITGCGRFGLEVFNVITSEKYDDVCENEVDELTHMEINSKRPTVVVSGTYDGKMNLWSIPWASFSNSTN